MRKTHGLQKILGVQAERQRRAEAAFEAGRCQIQGCCEKPVKVLSFTNGWILSLCQTHLDTKGL